METTAHDNGESLVQGVRGDRHKQARKIDTRAVLIEIRRRLRGATEDELLEEYRDIIKRDANLLDIVIAYSYFNDKRWLDYQPRPPREEPDAVREFRQKLTEGAMASVNGGTLMPDGRALGDWTVGELRRLGGVFGAVLAAVGDQDDGRKLRDVLTDAEWRALSAPQ